MSARVIVNGAAGRMGRLVATALRQADLGEVVGCDPAAVGRLELPDGALDVVGTLEEALAADTVIVDFSHANCTSRLVESARRAGARLVIGTTGQSEAQMEALRDAATRIAVLVARNFSLGINRLAQVLPQLGGLARHGFDVECIEAHHRQKRDAPSGTASLLLDALLGDGPPGDRIHGRVGPETQRHTGEVGVHSLRAGQIPGEHTLVLAGEHEVLELRHRALDRAAFVTGVVPAVHFVRRASPGLYSMLDVMSDAHAGEP